MSRSKGYQIRKAPRWMRAALNLIATEVPNVLATGQDDRGEFAPIATVVDAFQNGIGIADTVIVDDQPLAGGSGLLLLAPAPDPAFGYLLLGVSWSASALGATRNPRLIYRSANNSPWTGASGLALATVPTATAATVAWKDVTGDATARLFCPPGFTPAIFENDMIGGETLTVRSYALRIPAGFKPF